MTTSFGPGESYPDPATEQLLAATLDRIRGVIEPDLAEIVLPPDSILLGVQTEAYQSRALQAWRNVIPGRYPPVDRGLIILSLQADRQVFLVAGKIDPSDAFDMRRVLGGGVDLREINRPIYTYDGTETITEYMQDGSINIHTDDKGRPDFLLRYTRRALGAYVAVEALGKNLPPSQMLRG